MADAPVTINILCVGLEEATLTLLRAVPAQTQLMTYPYDLERLMEDTPAPPHVILCGPPPTGVSLIEVGQMLSMQHRGVPLYFAGFNREGYDRKAYVKNGFTDAFVLPMDKEVFKRVFQELFSKLSSGQVKSYRSVKLVDLEPGVRLDFDTTIYLPSNNKYIKLTSAGDPLDQDRLDKLKQNKMSTVYVSADQMPQFYKFTADRLKRIGSSETLSATERKERTESAIRELVSGLFTEGAKESTFEQGQALLADCKEIVNSYIFDSPAGDWYKRLLSTMGEMGNSYGHASNVSTYAALFAIGLQIGDPSELAIAGLMHDLGLADVNPNIVSKQEYERTPEEQSAYKKHPEHTINLLKRKKFVISDKIGKAILQHHEHFNGTGYPQGLVGSRITKEAQILALADRFDELTSVSEGLPLMTPREAVTHFKKMVIDDPGRMILDPELLQNVLKLFPEST